MVENYVTDLKRWMKQPYNENGDLVDWFLFIGVMVVSTFLWSRVIHRILN